MPEGLQQGESDSMSKSYKTYGGREGKGYGKGSLPVWRNLERGRTNHIEEKAGIVAREPESEIF